MTDTGLSRLSMSTSENPGRQCDADFGIKTGSPAYTIGSWVEDQLYLALIDRDGLVVDSRAGPGLRRVGGSPMEALSQLLAGWDDLHGPLPLTLCGMITSPWGWHKAACTVCPFDLEELPHTSVHFRDGARSVSTIPGLTCLNRTGSPDFLWGEETILYGALRLYPDLARGTKTVCIPGSYTRWIVLRNGRVLHFISSVAGKLFRLLSSDLLLAGGCEDGPIQPGIFADGFKEAHASRTIDLMYLVSQARSRMHDGQYPTADSQSFLLGLLIGRDIVAANMLLKFYNRSSLALVAEGRQRALYSSGFQLNDMPVTIIDAESARTAGLSELARAGEHNGAGFPEET